MRDHSGAADNWHRQQRHQRPKALHAGHCTASRTALSHQLSAISLQPSALSHQLSAISWQPSAVRLGSRLRAPGCGQNRWALLADRLKLFACCVDMLPR
ncbi:MAG: hypothetical protein DMF89_12660 [Acidobacteria bacterium]|nr:MAG: hypothetical protein DMF89_12660 [Acidobacteriota bacterium]